MFTNIFSQAKAHIKGGKNYPNLDGSVTFKETRKRCFSYCQN